ncbi:MULTISPECIES: non-heme iron oxygenase ferredoxin subunit [unclassified Micromonospora]|uniref:non-heme iron oxygenase ferredoxin subunit n=1 Tax=unclassified Micromonospora TaxID=2617518 RepID=UPI001B39C54A|nr:MULTISPECIES: non-heme iron oxygenase ferredoxin subunit [unclassified Micromonospora]MBQ1043431.1 non-heme iron oxygenase ferredoxin subunit [Micromonospora sp. C72]MBQ1053660.1 non-heme iron oxygenase ferredoxin subunit [Micromonospora sp. C32]
MLRICSTEDVPKGTVISADVDGVQVAIVHGGDDVFYAVHDECSHAAVALSEGEVEGCTLECWLHGSRFDLRTGEPTGLPATEPVPVYSVEVRDGDIYLSVDGDGRPLPSNGVTR